MFPSGSVTLYVTFPLVGSWFSFAILGTLLFGNVFTGTSTVSVEPSGYVTVAVTYNEPFSFVFTTLSDINVNPVTSLLTLTVPLSAVNVNVSLILLNSSSDNDAPGSVISLSITGATVVGVYFAACVLTLKIIR